MIIKYYIKGLVWDVESKTKTKTLRKRKMTTVQQANDTTPMNNKRKLPDIKKPRNAYNFFNIEFRKTISEEEKKKLNPQEMLSYIAKKWNEIDEEGKEKYKAMSNEDNKRFLEEVEKHGLDAKEFLKKKKKKGNTEEESDTVKGGKVKDPNLPQRPLNSFFLYKKDNLEDFRKKFTDMTPKEVMNELSKAWRDLPEDDETKVKYKTLAANMKMKYQAEVDVYMKSDTRKAWEESQTTQE